MARLAGVRRLKTSAAAALVVGVLAVAPAAAAPPPPPKQIRTTGFATGPLAATLGGKRYSLRLEVTQVVRKGPTTLTLTFDRAVGSSTQAHAYSFALGRRAFSCRGRPARCRLDSGRSLGRYGHVRVTIAASRRRRAAPVETGCTGTATRTAARAAASVRFLDRSASLTVRSSRRVRATLRSARFACSGFVECHTETLGLGGADPAAAFALVAPAGRAAWAQIAFTLPLRAIAPATNVARSITVRNLPTTSFAIAPDLSTASFNAEGLPFLSGSVAYTASRTVPQFSTECGETASTLGRVTGDVAALFDGIGRKPLTATGGYLQKTP